MKNFFLRLFRIPYIEYVGQNKYIVRVGLKAQDPDMAHKWGSIETINSYCRVSFADACELLKDVKKVGKRVKPGDNLD